MFTEKSHIPKNGNQNGTGTPHSNTARLKSVRQHSRSPGREVSAYDFIPQLAITCESSIFICANCYPHTHFPRGLLEDTF